MTSGEVQVRQRIREILRFAGILFPLALVFYSLTFWPAEIRGDSIYNFVAVVAPWLLFGLFMFLVPAKDITGVVFRLASYHVFLGTFALLVAGFGAAYVVSGWVLLLLVSYVYLEKKGLVLSVGLLIVFTVTDFLIKYDSETALQNSTAAAVILLFGSVLILLNRLQQADSVELLQSRAQESLQSNRMNTLINNLADAVMTIDQEGRIEIYNAASLNLLNTNVALKEKSIDEILDLHDQSGKSVQLLQLAKKTKTVKVRDDLELLIDDETVRLEVTISPVRGSFSRSKKQSMIDSYILILRDITKMKSLEEERDEFISVVSHELRTPITIAEGTLSNIQLMLDRGKTPPGTIERSLEEAHGQVLFLSRMVNDLSTLSRAERGVADAAEEINVKDLVNDLHTEYAPQAKKKQLLFDIEAHGTLGTVSASQLYLRELLQNIITNAIKYTKEGTITLKVRNTEGFVNFEVIDTGIGISKSDQVKIFNKFYRSEDYRTRETGGTGLGLYVAAKLARKLKTMVEVKSRLNHGSTFSFKLPSSK